ncbi:hypothetical protein ColLi_04669 [Colletotrichum liriopes]|uniref:Uncharacterized protein n=1 Tax=Colletotrichum liriopes TaxID=708192 RepID=A0AA37GK62_9PEZI|nr:hypothetical protein ColLi_04669 [Colletotrichum liriopes]
MECMLLTVKCLSESVVSHQVPAPRRSRSGRGDTSVKIACPSENGAVKAPFTSRNGVASWHVFM